MTLIEQRAAAQRLLRHVELAVVLVGMPRRQIRAHLAARVVGLADQPVGHQGAHLLRAPMEAIAVRHEREAAAALDLGAEPRVALEIDAQRLLDHQVQAGARDGHGVVVVQRGGRGDDRAVVRAARERDVPVGEHVGPGNAQVEDLLTSILTGIRHGELLRREPRRQQISHVSLADTPRAQNKNRWS